MTVIHVSLLVQGTVERTYQLQTEEVIPALFRLKLHVMPDGDPDVERLGLLDVQTEAQPHIRLEMTPAQTADWLCGILRRLL